MESTATQVCVPLMLIPSRPPPQVHQSVTTPLGTGDLLWLLVFVFFQFTAAKEILCAATGLTHGGGKLPCSRPLRLGGIAVSIVARRTFLIFKPDKK